MKEYEWQATLDGYEVYVSYAEDGPSQEEAWALFREAQNNFLYQNLGYLGEELER
jgi:hypothetical protein